MYLWQRTVDSRGEAAKLRKAGPPQRAAPARLGTQKNDDDNKQ